MKLEILNASVVVLAEHHNPTILHPSFLLSQKIVPEDWETIEVVCTPPFAMVKYANGIVFNVDVNKLQVTDNGKGNVKESQTAGLANAYVQTLPHVSYKAVGINFDGFVVCPEAKSLLLKKFLKAGSGNYNKTQPSALGLRFLYTLSGTQLVLNCDAGKVKRKESGDEQEGILVKANYHTDLPLKKTLGAIEKASSQFSKRCSHFMRVTKKILGMENKR